MGIFKKKRQPPLYFADACPTIEIIFRHVGTWLVSNLHMGYLALSIPAMNDHSPHFNNVLMRRPFPANIMKNLLFYAWKEKISKMKQPSCLLFFIVLRSKPTEFLFSQNILKKRCWEPGGGFWLFFFKYWTTKCIGNSKFRWKKAYYCTINLTNCF